ncbi:unnamed protein product [Ectocarpus fasciculatus]
MDEEPSPAATPLELHNGEKELSQQISQPPVSPSSVPVSDEKAVEQTIFSWMETVTSGTYDAPRQAAELYAPDGVFCGTEIFAPDDPLWGSASEVVRNTPEQIYAYYDHFARLPELRVMEYAHSPVRVRGAFATQAGTHTFAWQGAEGETTVEMRMRFGFTFRKDDDDHHHPGRPSRWSIVEHYSFALPTATAVAAAAAAAAAGASAPAEEPAVEPTEPTAEPAAEPEPTAGEPELPVEEPEPPAAEPEPPVEEPEPPVEELEPQAEETAAAPAAEPAAAEAPEESKGDGAGVDAAALQATADLLAEERTMLAQQIRELQQRAESAESLAAERAVLRATERVSRAKIDAQLLERAKNAEIIAAQRAEQIAELQRSVASEKSLAAERAQHNVELEHYAENAKSLAAQLATQMVELDRQVDNEIYI